MNKAELIDTLSKRLGDRKAATAALDSVLEEIQRAVAKGDRVALTGFGVFEKRIRNARTARNPRTGEAVKVKKTSIPSFRAGQGFKDVVTGTKKIARATAVKPSGGTAGKSTRETAEKSSRATAGATSKANGRAAATGGTTRQAAPAARSSAASGRKVTAAGAGRTSATGKKAASTATTRKSTATAPATKKASTRSASR